MNWAAYLGLAGLGVSVLVQLFYLLFAMGRYSQRLTVLEDRTKEDRSTGADFARTVREELTRQLSLTGTIADARAQKLQESYEILSERVESGFTMLRDFYATLSSLYTAHDYRLAHVEKGTGISAPRMTAIREPPPMPHVTKDARTK